MTRPASVRRGGVLLVALAIGLLAAPALAASAPITGYLSVTPSPDGKGVVGGSSPSSSPTLAGRFDVDTLVAIDSISLAVTPTGPQPASPLTAEGCEHLSGGSCNAPGSGAVSFSWTVPKLAYNGPYKATASASGHGASVGDLNCLDKCTGEADPVSFKVAVPPPSPTDATVAVNDAAKTAVLSWERDTQPDIVGYAIQRKGPADANFAVVGGGVPQPSSGRASFNDNLSEGGGTYTYQITALRVGGDGDRGNTSGWLLSKPATASGTAAGPTAPPPAGANGPSGYIDLAKLAGVKVPPKTPNTPRTAPEPPDTGYKQQLPYGPLPPTTAGPPDTDPEPGVAMGPPPGNSVVTKRTSSGPGRALWIPIVGGVGLVGLAGLLRWFSRRLA